MKLWKLMVAAGLFGCAVAGFGAPVEGGPGTDPTPAGFAWRGSDAAAGAASAVRVGVLPFSSLAVQVRGGLAGFGMDVATPITSKVNFRVGASFLSYQPSFSADGIDIVGAIKLKSLGESFDWYPFGGVFRISPGVLFYNGNHIAATASVPGGQTFTLNDVDYISSPSDPVKGTFDLAFGNQLAPTLTIGLGNMVPRRGGHWSFPLEIGAEYLGKTPRLTLALAGSACQGSTAPTNCGSINSDPTTAANVQAEQAKLNGNIPSQLRFFPILSTGVSYRFNLSRER